MKTRPLILLFLMLTCLSGLASAQDPATSATAAPRAIALSIVDNALLIARSDLPDNTLTIDFNPADASRWARTDQYGIIRYAPIGSPEGVYTFSPAQEGFGVFSPTENKIFVQQVAWSPRGDMMAFVINTPYFQEPSHGVWFWQPAREMATDPSYQLLRQCPPSCEMTINTEGIQWYARQIAWSADNNSLLIYLDLPQEGRRALAVRYAQRDPDNRQANTAPTPLRYDFGHWTVDGGNIVVSGTNPSGDIGYGLITRDGAVIAWNPISAPTLWVQDAVQSTDGRFYLFGTTTGRGTALQLMDDSFRALTPPLGSSAPRRIVWNETRTAALVVVDSSTFVVQIDGTVTDITSLTAGTAALDWTNAIPANSVLLPTPAPVVRGGDLPVKVGDILKVERETVTLYAEPIAGAAIAGVLYPGEELIIVSEPVESGDATWWRVQSINFTGWISSTQNMVFSGS